MGLYFPGVNQTENFTIPIPFGPVRNPSTVVKGGVGPWQQWQKAKYDPVRGFVYSYEWISPDQDVADRCFDYCANNGIAATLTLEKDKATLLVEDSTSEYIVDSWEIHANEEVRDLFSHPSVVSAIVNVVGQSNLGPIDISNPPTSPLSDMLTEIRTHLANEDSLATMFNAALDEFQDDPTAPYLLYDVLVDPVSGPLVADFYQLYLIGTTGYRRQQYVLKHKSNVSNRWSENVSDIGVDNIYSTADLLTEVTNPDELIFPLPGRLQYKLQAAAYAAFQAIPDQTPPDNYSLGWLKSSSTEITEGLNRVNIETDYVLELWDQYIYPLYIPGVSL